MKNIIAAAAIVTLLFACNTKQGTNEPTSDSELNPAELTVDSVGTNADMNASAATDSNRTGDPSSSAGGSDLQEGKGNVSGTSIGADGNTVDQKESK